MAAAVVVARGGKTPPPTIPGCKILGFKSRNNRTYTKEAIQAAVHKYEGVKVNLDHNTGTDPRKFSERFGRMVNVRFQPGQGLFGDLQYNPKHPLAEAFCWWIKNDPTAIGLSHNATAEVKNTAEGGEIVTEIRDVDSVDLVADPATTKGLFESYNERNAMTPDENPEMAPPPQVNTDMDQAPVDEAIDEGDNYAEHLGNAIMAIVNDAGLSAADKRKKILGALKLMDDEGAEPVEENDEDMMDPNAGGMPPVEPIDENEDMEPVEEGDDEAAAMEAALLGPEGEPDGDEMPMKKPAQESVQVAKLKAQLDAYRVQESLRKKRARLLRTCKEAKIPTEAITTVFVTQLMKLKESAWPKLVADRKAVAKRTIVKPVSTSVAATDNYNQFLNELINS